MTNAVHSGASTTRAHINRRSLLATVAAAAVSPAAIANAVGEPDPVFGAIQVHKNAHKSVEIAAHAHSLLEREIVASGVRMSTAREDDPRLTASENAMSAAYDVEADAACDILGNSLPTTMAGVCALLSYAVEADTDGVGWPEDLCESESVLDRRSWQQILIARLAEILPDILRAGI